jgi:methylglyoxal synthase
VYEFEVFAVQVKLADVPVIPVALNPAGTADNVLNVTGDE